MRALREASPQARRHFTRFDQVEQLVRASEADPDTGFMARLMALCSLPRADPGGRLQYKRVNGPYTLIMTAVGKTGLPFGNIPRLLLAWVSTEAVRTQSRELFLGTSLSGFMRKLGVYSTSGEVQIRLRSQMKRLFNAHIQLVYEDEQVSASVNAPLASRTEFWWNPRQPHEHALWESKIELGDKFFQEIVSHPVPLDMNILKALRRSPAGPRSLPLAHLPDVLAEASATALLAAPLPPIWGVPRQGGRKTHCPGFPHRLSAGADQDQAGLAGSELRGGEGGVDPLALETRHLSHAPSARAVALKSSSLPRESPSHGVGLAMQSVFGSSESRFRPQESVIRGSFPRPNT